MTAEPSPRPWRVNGHSIEANDPDGLWLQNEKTGWGVVANLPSCPKSRMSKKNREKWDEIVEANAALIVSAVNKHGMPIVELIKAYDALEAERDRAVKYAEAAPHPGSAPWKEMRSVYAERDRLRLALNEVCSRVSVALNCPMHETEQIDLLVHALLGIKECARAAIGGEKQ